MYNDVTSSKTRKEWCSMKNNRNLYNVQNNYSYNYRSGCFQENDSVYCSSALSAKTNSFCIRSNQVARGTRSLTVLRYVVKLLACIFNSDRFAAYFVGFTLFAIVGIIGGVEFGRLAINSGIIYSFLLLICCSVVIYRKNKQ